MRVVIQRVSEAKVDIVEGGNVRAKSRIGAGLLVLAAFCDGDTEADLDWIVSKIVNLRVFEDGEGKMNLSLSDVGGDLMIVSQFTLYGNLRKGSRPSFNRSACADVALDFYEEFLRRARAALGREIAAGEFGAMMNVSLVNDGPITIIIDSKDRDL